MPKSRVFISRSTFEPVGRAKGMLSQRFPFPKGALDKCIRTKVYPIGDFAFAIKANQAPSIYSDGRMIWRKKPEWANKINSMKFTFDETKGDTMKGKERALLNLGISKSLFHLEPAFKY